jgi:hypothetical protein
MNGFFSDNAGFLAISPVLKTVHWNGRFFYCLGIFTRLIVIEWLFWRTIHKNELFFSDKAGFSGE